MQSAILASKITSRTMNFNTKQHFFFLLSSLSYFDAVLWDRCIFQSAHQSKQKLRNLKISRHFWKREAFNIGFNAQKKKKDSSTLLIRSMVPCKYWLSYLIWYDLIWCHIWYFNPVGFINKVKISHMQWICMLNGWIWEELAEELARSLEEKRREEKKCCLQVDVWSI